MVYVRSAVLTEASGRRWSLSGRPAPGPALWYVEDVTGWVGGSGVRGEVTARMGHGDHVSTAEREGRVMTVKGAVACESSDLRDELGLQLSSVLGDGEWGLLEADNGADAGVLATRVRLDGAPQIVEVGTRKLRFQIPVRSESETITAANVQRVAVAAPGTGVGLRFPLFSEGGVLTYGATSVATTGVLVNAGTAPAWPVFWPRGQFVNGWRIWQDGHLIEWNGVAVDVAQAADTARRAVEIWGTDVSQFLSADDFRPIPPGGSAEIRFEPLGGGAGILEATVASTYI